MMSAENLREKYPLLSGCRDWEYIKDNLSEKMLGEVEAILEADGKMIELKVPRYENGEPMFDGEFELEVLDDTYIPNGLEILVMKWIEDMEDTGFMVWCLKDEEEVKCLC